MESSLLNSCCGIFGVFCFGIFVVESLLWKLRCWIIVVEYVLRLLLDSYCGIVVVESLLWDRCCGISVVEEVLLSMLLDSSLINGC